MEVISDGNMNLHKELKSIRNGKYFFNFKFKNPLKIQLNV